MHAAEFLSLLIVLFGEAIVLLPKARGRFALKFSRWLVIISVVLISAAQAQATRNQFLAWHNDTAFGQYLLPPYQNIGYFVRYAFVHFWASYLIAGVLALAVFWITRFLNKKFGERFFEREELYFLALGIFLSSHPAWILYITIIIVWYFIVALCALLARHSFSVGGRFAKETHRVSFYYFWLPAVALAIIASQYMSGSEWYNSLML